MKKVGFLILGILIVDIYFIYHHVSNIQNNSYQVLKVDSNLVKDLYEMVNPSEDATVLKGIYQNDTIQNQYILAIGISNYLKKNNLQSPQYIKRVEVERMIHSILGYNFSFVHEDVYLLHDGICGYRYDSNLDSYENMGGCDGNSNEKFYRKIVFAEQTGDWVLLTEKMIYLYDDWNTDFSRKFIYNHMDRENVLNVVSNSVSEPSDISIDDYLNDASTYVYYFRLKNGEYILEGIKRSA